MSYALRWCLIATMATAIASTAPAQDLRGLTVTASGGLASRICGFDVVPPRQLPPPNSGPVVFLIAPCFEQQGRVSVTHPTEYLRDIQLRPSLVSQGLWVPFDRAAERVIFEDTQRPWTNHRLLELSVTIGDYRFQNGASAS
jgi:hypothetical protein